MPEFKFTNIKINGIMTAIPKQVRMLDTFIDQFGEVAVSKFKKVTGIEEIHISEKRQTASDLGFVAAEELIKCKSINREDIGFIVFVSKTPDYRVPSTACVLHKRLLLSKDCMAFDVNLGCSGFVYGLEIACSLLSSHNANKALLIVGDTTSKMVSPLDKSVAMLFGDGASAILLSKEQTENKIIVRTKSNGNGFKSIIIPAGGFRNQFADEERVQRGDGNTRSDFDLYMNGTEVFNFTISEVPKIINNYFNSTIRREDFDVIALHQANKFIIKQIAKKTKIPMDKIPLNLAKFGNTSGNSIPMLLNSKFENITNENLRILSCGFGVGLSWGIADFIINTDDLFPVIETSSYYTEGTVSHG